MWFTFLEWWLCLGNWLSGGWLIFAIYYTAIYCGHNSMATKWRAKVFDSEKRRTGNSVPQDAYPLDSSCLSSRISACFARFFGGGGLTRRCPWRRREMMDGAIDVCNGWMECEWDWMEDRMVGLIFCARWWAEMIRSVRKIVDFSDSLSEIDN